MNSITVPGICVFTLAGGVSGAIGWFISFPLDCIKANIQGRSMEASVRGPKLNFIDVGSSLLRSKGIAGLYAGIIPSILRAFVVSSSRFSAYEGALHALEKF